MEIERSFHQLKSFVEIRPLYHHNEERIKTRVGICVLAYLLNNTVMHMVRQHEDFEELRAQSVYSYLKSCRVKGRQRKKAEDNRADGRPGKADRDPYRQFLLYFQSAVTVKQPLVRKTARLNFFIVGIMQLSPKKWRKRLV